MFFGQVFWYFKGVIDLDRQGMRNLFIRKNIIYFVVNLESGIIFFWQICYFFNDEDVFF